ncbi:capsular polysaccharide biosynthesis protein Cps14C [Streptococcus pneumoniae]|nr:capsular polysaccharide biosynthesis protein Cps14C [Streptococcus pneumoniae]
MKEQNTLEIDVLQLFRALWKRKLVILLVAIITSSVAFAYSTFVIKPEFTSTTRIYVVNRNQEEKSGLTNQTCRQDHTWLKTIVKLSYRRMFWRKLFLI